MRLVFGGLGVSGCCGGCDFFLFIYVGVGEVDKDFLGSSVGVRKKILVVMFLVGEDGLVEKVFKKKGGW